METKTQKETRWTKIFESATVKLAVVLISILVGSAISKFQWSIQKAEAVESNRKAILNNCTIDSLQTLRITNLEIEKADKYNFIIMKGTLDSLTYYVNVSNEKDEIFMEFWKQDQIKVQTQLREIRNHQLNH
jgi:hypothetical protein